MGQKIHPKGLRLGIYKEWDARWYARGREFVDLLHEDLRIRKFVKEKLQRAAIARLEIERSGNRIRLTIHAGKPGVVIGKGGAGAEELRRSLEAMSGKMCHINIMEVKKPDMEAQLVSESIASALEKRVSFKRAMKQAVGRAIRLGAKGIKVMVSGRLGGAEMARREWYWEGTVPLHTLRADIDYGFTEAKTTFGTIGVKVWIYKGQILPGATGGVGPAGVEAKRKPPRRERAEA